MITDPERDAWLSEALRHAPDAQAAPPTALSDAILRQARAATSAGRSPARLPARSPWGAAWDWLARPPIAAGLASVMVATLIGLMWWDQPMNPTMTRPPASDATAPPVAAPPMADAAPQPPAPAPAEVTQAAAEAEPAARRKPAAPKPAPRPVEAEPARSVAPSPAPATASERESPAPFADRRAAADAGAAEGKVEAARDESRAGATSGALARGAAAKAAAPAARRTDTSTEARPAAFGSLLASVAAEPERWGWERSGSVQPVGPALQGWLARLDAAASGARWQPAADAAASGETAVLRLYRDGALAATLRLDDASIGLASGPRAALPPATLATLKQALDDATR